MRISFARLAILLLLCSCQSSEKKETAVVRELPIPAEEGMAPNLFVAENGDLYLSWVAFVNDTTDALLYSILKEGEWTAPTEVARSSDWFVNWADCPSLVAYPDEGRSLAVHWLEKSSKGTYDYDVRIAQSIDGGENWGASFIVHRDSVAAEHGFVTMLPISEDRIFATWLDGRNTKNEEKEHDHDHSHHGAMTLRTAEFDQAGRLYEEQELDHRICDCCQTAAVLTTKGPIIAYRDRSDTEIRDISIVRKVNGAWTSPQTIYADNWKIAGCPVNGPSIVAEGDFVAVAWFSAADSIGAVKVAFSEDAGASFSEPVKVSGQNPLGRVDLLLAEGRQVLVSWVEIEEEVAGIQMVRVGAEGMIGQSRKLVEVSPTRDSGFPRLARVGEKVYMVWTGVRGEKDRFIRMGELEVD